MLDAFYVIFIISTCMLIYNLWMTFIQPRIDDWISDREYLKREEFNKQQQHNRTLERLRYDAWKAERKAEKLRKHNATQHKG